MDSQTLELAEAIQEWHKNKVDQLELVNEHSEAGIKLGDVEIEAGTDLHKGFKLGVFIALEQFKELPFSLERNESETQPTTK
ncbi:hypothetical protein NVP1103O_65 [Vibrio phage 1.103.O._10N.261.52.F2]|nr:hypothetical protein NVP1103O_65 [Vibrio phage 1.103.O._10N.261.52.F2]